MTRSFFVLSLLAGCVDPKDSGAPTTGVDTADDTGTAAARDCAPPSVEPAKTAYGHLTDGWRWTRQGPLFADRDGLGTYQGDLAPALVDTGAGLHLLYVRQDSTGQSLWASRSDDGKDWSEPVPVTGLEDAGSYPSLVYADGTFHLFEGSGSITHATSTDGVAFTPGEVVLRTDAAGAFASLSMLYPSAVLGDDGSVALWYTGFDGARYAIGSAAAPSLGAAASDGALVLERDAEGWDNTSVAMPAVVQRGGARHLWYGGYDTVVSDPGPWRVGYLDPDTGERRVSIPLSETGADAWSSRDPAVVPWGDGWLMVYIGLGDDGIYRLLSATSDVCN